MTIILDENLPKGLLRMLVPRQVTTVQQAGYTGMKNGRFLLFPKVSAALWERTREAKLRFGGQRERLGEHDRSRLSLERKRSLAGTGVPKALR